MNVILGASGQVGGRIVQTLADRNIPVRAVVRNRDSAFDSRVEVRYADLFDGGQVTAALAGGTTVFLITPEKPTSTDVIGETRQILDTYRAAIHANGIRRVVGLSSMGAELEGDTGNLKMSAMLEAAFDDLDVDRLFIRPAYYYSNWLGFLESVQQEGVLPTFFPADLQIDMASPMDVAAFVADRIVSDDAGKGKRVVTLPGPARYSSRDVAEAFSTVLKKPVVVQEIPREAWKKSFLSAGFTEDAAVNMVAMTQAVVDGKTVAGKDGAVYRMPTTLELYIRSKLA